VKGQLHAFTFFPVQTSEQVWLLKERERKKKNKITPDWNQTVISLLMIVVPYILATHASIQFQLDVLYALFLS
jgi:hypothetical protein